MVKADRADAKRRGRFFKALGDEIRQRILALLIEREMCVCEILTALSMTQPTTSHHLKILEEVDLVRSSRDGKWVFYGMVNKKMVSQLISEAVE